MTITMGVIAAPVHLTIDRIQVQQIGANCVAYMLYHDDSQKAFVFPLYLSTEDGQPELGKTYTLAEMNTVYAYWILFDYSTHALYTAATFTKTEGTNKEIRIDATASDTNGDDWVLVYDESDQAVHDVQAAAGKVTKYMENGQIIIEKSGVIYNVQGVQVH